MPAVLRVDGFKFFIYSNENNEPAHIHVIAGHSKAKFWLNPVRLASAKRCNRPTITKLFALVRAHEGLFLEKWNEHFTR